MDTTSQVMKTQVENGQIEKYRKEESQFSNTDQSERTNSVLTHSSESEEKKPRSTKYCLTAEKKFPKIRISMKDYNHLKQIRQRYHCKSFGQAIARVLDCYHRYSQ